MKERTYSRDIVDCVKSFLNKEDWQFSFDEDNGIFHFGLRTKGMIKDLNYVVAVNADNYVVYVISPIGADERNKDMMASMAEFVCRANYGLQNGCFELDMRDGEVRYKSFVDCDGVVPSDEVVKNSILCPEIMFDRYGDGIIDIIFGRTTAKEAIERCEKATRDNLRSLIDDLAEATEDDEIRNMFVRLAERFGFSANLSADENAVSISQAEGEIVNTDLFSSEGETDE